MQVDDADLFVANLIDRGATVVEALKQLSENVRLNLQAYRSRSEALFPLGARSAKGNMFHCVALVQEIDTNVNFYSLNHRKAFSATVEDGSKNELVDVSEFYLIPVPGSMLYNSSNCSVADGDEKHRKARGTKRRNDDAKVDPTDLGSELQCGAASSVLISDASMEQLNLPHPPIATSLATACIASALGALECTVRLNDVVEVFGFLRDDEGDANVDAQDDSWEWNASSLPHGLVARLTIVHLQQFTAPTLQAIPTTELSSFVALRNQAIATISNCCWGDEIAAEYILMSMASTVVHRFQEMPIGDVPLYLWVPHLSTDAFSRLESLLRSITPIGCVSIHLQSQHHRLLPRKDYDLNVLSSGALQFAKGTTVLIDPFEIDRLPSLSRTEETLFDLIHKQCTKIDYKYNTIDVETNANVIVMSSQSPGDVGAAVLNLACAVKVIPSSTSPTAGFSAGDESRQREAIQNYIECCRRGLERLSTGDESLTERIATDLSNMAQLHPKRFNRDSVLHNNTVSMVVGLTRVRAATFGRPSVTQEDYEALKELEAIRCERLT